MSNICATRGIHQPTNDIPPYMRDNNPTGRSFYIWMIFSLGMEIPGAAVRVVIPESTHWWMSTTTTRSSNNDLLCFIFLFLKRPCTVSSSSSKTHFDVVLALIPHDVDLKMKLQSNSLSSNVYKDMDDTESRRETSREMLTRQMKVQKHGIDTGM
jgi:hypothetical protein